MVIYHPYGYRRRDEWGQGYRLSIAMHYGESRARRAAIWRASSRLLYHQRDEKDDDSLQRDEEDAYSLRHDEQDAYYLRHNEQDVYSLRRDERRWVGCSRRCGMDYSGGGCGKPYL